MACLSRAWENLGMPQMPHGSRLEQGCDSSSTGVFTCHLSKEKSRGLLNDSTRTNVASDGQIAGQWKPLITEVQMSDTKIRVIANPYADVVQNVSSMLRKEKQIHLEDMISSKEE